MSFASVYGAARRSDYSPGTRLVLACIESHAIGVDDPEIVATWNATDKAIAREMGLSRNTVSRGVAKLEAGGDLRAVRHKRRRTTYELLQRGADPAGPRHEPEIEARITPELSPQIGSRTAELSPQIATTTYPTTKSPTEEGRERAPASPTTPPPAHPVDEIGGEGKEAAPPPEPLAGTPERPHGRPASRIEQGTPPPPEPPTARRSSGTSPAPRERATRWHDDAVNDPDLRRTIAEAGHDPDEITGEIAAWAASQAEPPVRRWPGFAVRWIALKPRFDGRGAKRDWRAENDAFVAETERLLHVPEGWAYVGVAP